MSRRFNYRTDYKCIPLYVIGIPLA